MLVHCKCPIFPFNLKNLSDIRIKPPDYSVSFMASTGLSEYPVYIRCDSIIYCRQDTHAQPLLRNEAELYTNTTKQYTELSLTWTLTGFTFHAVVYTEVDVKQILFCKLELFKVTAVEFFEIQENSRLQRLCINTKCIPSALAKFNKENR